MRWSDWLEEWGMTNLKIQIPFLEMEWAPQDADKAAAWELYIELLTRVSTQPLPEDDGDELSALNSIYSLFPSTREVIKRNGRECVEFTKIAIVVLNQIVRPFTAKWHKLSIEGAFEDEMHCKTFRMELTDLQEQLNRYTRMLGHMAGVEKDLTQFEG